MPRVTRREIVAGAVVTPGAVTSHDTFVEERASFLLRVCAGPSSDRALTTLWHRFLGVEARLAGAWAAVDCAQVGCAPTTMQHLVERADAFGHEHDRIVQQIASRPALSWSGVAIKLMAWRRIAKLHEFNLPDADASLAFSAYLDALRLSLGASGAAHDAAIAHLALRDVDPRKE
jgi:hypothetical protein